MKDRMVNVRMNSGSAERLAVAARVAGLTKSEILRRGARREVEKIIDERAGAQADPPDGAERDGG